MVLVNKQKNNCKLFSMKYKKFYSSSNLNIIKLAVSKNGGARRSKTTKGIDNAKKSPWLWILSGVLAGVLISSTIFIKFNSQSQSLATIKQNLKNTVKKTIPKSTASKEKEPIFDFYTVLPNMDATATNNTEPKKLQTVKNYPAEITAEVKTATIRNIKYLLQVATFTQIDAADELKAELTLEGFDATIEPIKKNNTTWYRIVMGPFNSEQQAIKQQQLLAKQNINGNLLKIEQ